MSVWCEILHVCVSSVSLFLVVFSSNCVLSWTEVCNTAHLDFYGVDIFPALLYTYCRLKSGQGRDNRDLSLTLTECFSQDKLQPPCHFCAVQECHTSWICKAVVRKHIELPKLCVIPVQHQTALAGECRGTFRSWEARYFPQGMVKTKSELKGQFVRHMTLSEW